MDSYWLTTFFYINSLYSDFVVVLVILFLFLLVTFNDSNFKYLIITGIVLLLAPSEEEFAFYSGTYFVEHLSNNDNPSNFDKTQITVIKKKLFQWSCNNDDLNLLLKHSSLSEEHKLVFCFQPEGKH